MTGPEYANRISAKSVRTWGDPRRGGERGSPYGPAPGGQSRVRYPRKPSSNPGKLPVSHGSSQRDRMYPLCCSTVGTSVEGSGRTTAAFFDLDKTIISRSSTLAFAPAFYRLGLITRSQVFRGACAQLTFRLTGASHYKMERIRDQLSALCQGWDALQISQIVTDALAEVIVPHVYAEARAL